MKSIRENYSPLYFLSALGSGGLGVSFFMYLQFMIPHPKTPMVTFNEVSQVVMAGDYKSVLAVMSLIGIAFFGFNHFRLLFKNLSWYFAFKKTPAHEALKNSNAGIGLMAIPLTLAMSLNVFLVMGALAIPNLWKFVEYLFPVTLLGFFLVGLYASSIFSNHMIKVVVNGDSSFVNTNNLSQLLSIFTFSMIAVGFAAPGAMSHFTIVNAIGIFFAIFYLSMALIIALIKLVLGFRAILEHGIAKEAAPTLWLVIPFLTLGGITLIRMFFGLDHHFGSELKMSSLFVLTSIIVSLQVLTGVFGWAVMKRIGYFKDFVSGDKKSVGSFSLICPGVAFFVFGMFFVHFGLVKNEIVDKFSILYFASIIPFFAVQVLTVVTFFKLGNKLLKAEKN